MAEIKVGGRKVDVDIEAELSRFTWYKAKWGTNRLLACSPFRFDSSPSFYCYLDDTATAFAGSWGDSGGTDYKKGNFVTLLAFLMDVTEGEAIEYLLAEYASEWDGDSKLTLDLSKMKEQPHKDKPLDSDVLNKYKYRSNYLAKRGISEAVQRLMQIGYDRKANAITFPYFLPDGQLATIKYRNVDNKFFYYAKNGIPVRKLIYGIDVVYKKNLKSVVVTEAEIDAMYAMTAAKKGAIAIGNSKLSDEKADVIKRSPIEELVVAADNDEAGEALFNQIKEKLGAYVRIKRVDFPDKYKDLNDISDTEKVYAYVNTPSNIGAVTFNV